MQSWRTDLNPLILGGFLQRRYGIIVSRFQGFLSHIGKIRMWKMWWASHFHIGKCKWRTRKCPWDPSLLHVSTLYHLSGSAWTINISSFTSYLTSLEMPLVNEGGGGGGGDDYKWTKENSLIFPMHYEGMPNRSRSFNC